MKNILTQLFLTFLTVTCYAQVDFKTFNLDSFRLPDIHWKALYGEGSLSSYYQEWHRPDYLVEKNVTSHFRPRLNLNYDQYINRSDLQATQNFNFLADFSTRKNPQILNSQQYTSFDTRFSYYNDRRKYKEISFSEKGLNSWISYNYDRVKNIDTIIDINKSKELTVSLNPFIGFGKGRLEPVSFVAMALFILQDAERLGVPLSTLDTEDVYAYARLMAEVRNRRILDSREMRIAELRELYAFMTAQGWVLENDPGFFTVLTDNWLYTNLAYRLSGSRWRYLLSPQLEYGNNFSVSNSLTDDYLNYALRLSVEFEKQRPINMYRQHWRRHELAVRGGRAESYFLTTAEPYGTYGQISLNNQIGRSWFPNNRTSLSGSLNLDYDFYQFFDTIQFSEENQHVVTAGAGISGTYFFSYRTQLLITGLLQYGYSTGGAIVSVTDNLYSSNKTSAFNGSLNARFLVALY